MGNPKKQRRKHSRPKKPYSKDRIEKERAVMKEFGLRRKKEIWRTESLLRNYRRRARSLQARRDEAKEAALFDKLNSIGISAGKIDDILSAQLADLLSRRLQTLVFKKGLASSPRHSRQLIVHGHVLLNGRKAKYPGIIVNKSDEGSISLDKKVSNVLSAVNKEENAEGDIVKDNAGEAGSEKTSPLGDSADMSPKGDSNEMSPAGDKSSGGETE